MVQTKVPTVSKKFMAQARNVLREGLVNDHTTEDYSTNRYALPLPKPKIRTFGSLGFSPAHVGSLKNAIDFYCDEGTAVFAAEAGKVISVRGNSTARGTTTKFWDRGNYVDIEHKHSEYTWYEHLKAGHVYVEAGDDVKRGELIALSGNTGFTENPHLHFQVNRYWGSGLEDYVTLRARFVDFPDVYKLRK